MIRHTASTVLQASAFIQSISTDRKDRKMTARKNKKADLFADDTTHRTNIASLIKIACNTSNSATLRDMACERLGEEVSQAPKFAAFAARELFAKCDAGAPPENVFNALIRVIREFSLPPAQFSAMPSMPFVRMRRPVRKPQTGFCWR